MTSAGGVSKAILIGPFQYFEVIDLLGKKLKKKMIAAKSYYYIHKNFLITETTHIGQSCQVWGQKSSGSLVFQQVKKKDHCIHILKFISIELNDAWVESHMYVTPTYVESQCILGSFGVIDLLV